MCDKDTANRFLLRLFKLAVCAYLEYLVDIANQALGLLARKALDRQLT